MSACVKNIHLCPEKHATSCYPRIEYLRVNKIRNSRSCKFAPPFCQLISLVKNCLQVHEHAQFTMATNGILYVYRTIRYQTRERGGFVNFLFLSKSTLHMYAHVLKLVVKFKIMFLWICCFTICMDEYSFWYIFKYRSLVRMLKPTNLTVPLKIYYLAGAFIRNVAVFCLKLYIFS